MVKLSLDVERLIGSVWPVSRETWDRLSIYVGLLEQWQKRINLIAPSTISDIWARHIADSVQTFAARPQAQSWIDIGSGAGFPGLVTAILLAQEQGGRVELIESVGKKCAFMSAVVRETGLKESGVAVQIYPNRLEKTLPDLAPAEAISARALASLKDLLTMTEGRLTDDAVGVFAKGRDHMSEIEEARKLFAFEVDVKPSVLGDISVLLTVSNVQRIG